MISTRGIMPTGRLEAFSDGVLAIITIMVLWLVPDRRIERAMGHE